MGLCLYVFATADEDDDPEEIAYCNVGHYSDFGHFRDTIAARLDETRFPVLLLHSDCDGEWTPREIPALERELREIGDRFKRLPPEAPADTDELVADAKSLYDCFRDVDGQNLFEAILALCAVAREHKLPITFM